MLEQNFAAGRGSVPCAAEGCRRAISAGKLMCLAHWRLVPLVVQANVARAWRTVLASPLGLVEREAYKRARQEAIDAVRTREQVQ